MSDTTKQLELTPLSIGLGVLLGCLLTAANVYLGLYAGMTVAASIPAAVISMGLFALLKRKGSLLQSNIVQTIASAGESLAAGIIFTVPALVIIGTWTEFEFWPTSIIAISGGLLGVIFMIPLRKALIVDNKELRYPEGVACASVLKTASDAETAKGGVALIAKGFLWGAAFKLASSALGLIKGSVEFATKLGSRNFYMGTDVSPALLAVGYIVNWNIAMLMFLGGAIGWLIGIPLLGTPASLADASALDASWELWSSQIRYLGVGAMIVGGVHSIVVVRKGISSGVNNLLSEFKDSTPNAAKENISLRALSTVFLLSFVLILGLYKFLLGTWGMTLLTSVLMVILSFFLVAVASYIVGLVGSSNSPVSGMTISALLGTGILLLVFGYEGESAILATLGVAAVVCCATCTSGDVCQDLKTGHLLGASPRSQQIAQFFGVIIPAFVIAPVLTLLHQAYVIGEGLKAPQAVLFANLTQGIFGQGQLPISMILWGAVIGLSIVSIDELYLKKKNSAFRMYLMPLAVGIYLPLSLSVPILIGGVIRALVEKKLGAAQNDAQDSGVLFGSGLIAGEALLGILIAILIVAKINLKMSFLSSGLTDLFSIIAMALLGYVLMKKAQKR